MVGRARRRRSSLRPFPGLLPALIPERPEGLGRHAFTFVDQPEQDVLCPDEVVAQQPRLSLGPTPALSSSAGKALKQCSPPPQQFRCSAPGVGQRHFPRASPPSSPCKSSVPFPSGRRSPVYLPPLSSARAAGPRFGTSSSVGISSSNERLGVARPSRPRRQPGPGRGGARPGGLVPGAAVVPGGVPPLRCRWQTPSACAFDRRSGRHGG